MRESSPVPWTSALWLGLVASLLTAATPLAADGGVTFSDVAAGGANGLVYQRVPSARQAIFEQIAQMPFVTGQQIPLLPLKPRGAPGVAILDYDGDGDLDLYVTNGPGAANSLFSNQLAETGQTTFLDMSAAAGVGAVDQDSQGVCYGDIDNDGDPDLLVLGNLGPNRLFENQGDGTFQDISAPSGVGASSRTSTACSMGDVDGNGLLDIAVANSYQTWDNQFPYFIDPFGFNEHNQLLLNTGGNVFVDASTASGIEDHAGLPPGTALLTWAIALVDYDLDGDLDLLTADDQTVLPPAIVGGLDVGFNRLFRNDGTGHFSDITFDAGLNHFGAWMGLSFGDVNCDGHLDFFSTNMGDYAISAFGQFPPGLWASRWFLGQGDGTFADPGVGGLVATPFGWGTSMPDYDNDGDTDILFHGGFQLFTFVEATNPGVILQNQGCSASFTYDTAALAGSTNHSRRNVQGVAVGDLDANGFVDLVSVSNFDSPEPIPLIPFGVAFGSPFDTTSFLIPTFLPAPTPGQFIWTGIQFPNGSLSVELNSGGNGNNWVEVEVVGSVGLTSGGRVNRDGTGAVVRLRTQQNPNAALRPVVGGSSYGSQDSSHVHLGLGGGNSGTLEVLWPGGVRNRLRKVRAGERIVFPEIPCDFYSQFENRPGYVQCVNQALDELIAAGVLDAGDRGRFLGSALACQGGPNTLCLGNSRFQAEIEWENTNGQKGAGHAVPVANANGLFYFRNPNTTEVHLNVLDGCGVNGHYWVFAGASTNAAYTMRVTDTLTESERSYSNQLGHIAAAVTDTRAFATCP